jgi:hypothetical protein
MTTMLQLMQQATAEMGLAVPTAVASSAATDTIQQLALLNAVGNELARQYVWQALDKEYRFTTQYLATTGTWTTSAATVTGIPTTAALAAGTWMVLGNGIPQDTYILSVDSATQVTLTNTPTAAATAGTITFCKTKYAFPSDYDRPVDRTQWDKSKHWEMIGPETSQQWQWLKSGFIATGPRLRFRPLGGTFQIWPPIASNDLLGFEYISNGWVTTAAGVSQSSFTADNDTCIFPDRLMVQGLKLKYFEIKGFDTTALYRDYNMQLDIAKANDSGSQTLSLAPRLSTVLIDWYNIPDSGYGI